MRIRNRMGVAAAMVSAATLLLAGCSSADTSGDPSSTNISAAWSSDCAQPSAKVTDANHKPGEPMFGLITPAGWERSTSADNDVVRLVIGNKSMASNNFAPNAVVTVEKSPAADIASELERQLTGLKQSTANPVDLKTETAGTTCGFPSQTFTFQAKNSTGSVSSATTTIFLVPNATGSTVAVLTVQTTDPSNQEYQDTLQKMIKEFQIKK